MLSEFVLGDEVDVLLGAEHSQLLILSTLSINLSLYSPLYTAISTFHEQGWKQHRLVDIKNT